MFPGFSSEYVPIRRAQPIIPNLNLPFRKQAQIPAKEVFQKQSAKLKELELRGVEFAEKYLFHQYRRNRRPNTLELNYTTLTFFLNFLKTQGLTHLEGVTR